MQVIVKEAMANGRLLKGPLAARVQASADKVGVCADALCLAAVMVQVCALGARLCVVLLRLVMFDRRCLIGASNAGLGVPLGGGWGVRWLRALCRVV
jgi:hypothetical protein